MTDASGYLHETYARSFGEFGDAIALPASGGWMLERSTVDRYRDGMGCYPLFCCAQWDRLHEDLDALEGRLITATVVTDPFGGYDEPLLRSSFDQVHTFKNQYVTELSAGVDACVSSHHRYYARRALRQLEVYEHEDPVSFLDSWEALYSVLVCRHRLTGIKAFSRSSFAHQLAVPGLRLFVAREHEVIVGAHMWYLQGEVAYSHLQATSDRGYELRAAYALYLTAFQRLESNVRWLALGAGAGPSDAANGLTAFKAGWATGQRRTWLCCRVFDVTRYAALSLPVISRTAAAESYLPAYRFGEWD